MVWCAVTLCMCMCVSVSACRDPCFVNLKVLQVCDLQFIISPSQYLHYIYCSFRMNVF